MKIKDLDNPDDAGYEGICEHCEEEMGIKMINPYDKDVHGIEKWEFICSKCYASLSNDI